jgi:hypothetical protein
MNKNSRDDKVSIKIPASDAPGSIGVPPVKNCEDKQEAHASKRRRIQPVSTFKITRRNLPHWQEPGRVYFLSWRCKDGLSLSPEARTITLKAIRYWDGRKWKVYAAVVMPDHVHALVQPLTLADGSAVNLGEIIHSVKSFGAHQINKLLGFKGSF